LSRQQVFYRSESASHLSNTIGTGSASKWESFSSKPPAKYSALEGLAKMQIDQEKAHSAALDLQLQRIVETELIEQHAETLSGGYGGEQI
jgi:hypothetical protein